MSYKRPIGVKVKYATNLDRGMSLLRRSESVKLNISETIGSIWLLLSVGCSPGAALLNTLDDF